MNPNKIFKCEMTYTSNDVFRYKVGSQGLGTFDRDVFWFNNFHTSYITEIKKEQTTLTITTRNSVYIFELLEPVDIENWKISPEKQQETEEFLKDSK